MSRKAPLRLTATNVDTGAIVASHVRVATRPVDRAIGLLSRRRFYPGEGLLITPCRGVHTWGMRFAIDLVALLLRTANTGRARYVEWPPEKKAIDIGDFYADSSLIKRTVGWQPSTPLREGLSRTMEFYRAHMHHYVPSTASEVAAL